MQDAPGRSLSINGVRPALRMGGTSEPACEGGRGAEEGGAEISEEDGDRNFVHSGTTPEEGRGAPEEGRGAGWPQAPQLLDFFSGAGFARPPVVAPLRRMPCTGVAPNERMEQVSPFFHPPGKGLAWSGREPAL